MKISVMMMMMIDSVDDKMITVIIVPYSSNTINAV